MFRVFHVYRARRAYRVRASLKVMRPREITFPRFTWRDVRRAALDLDIPAAEFVRRATVAALKQYRENGEGPAPFEEQQPSPA